MKRLLLLISLSLHTISANGAEITTNIISKALPLYEGSLWKDKSDPGKIVDEIYLAKTKEWKEYEKEVLSLEFDSVDVYEDDKRRDELYYIGGNRILMIARKKQVGKKDEIIQRNFFKNDVLYISQQDFDKNEVPCVHNYVVGNSPKFVEFCWSNKSLGERTWFSF